MSNQTELLMEVPDYFNEIVQRISSSKWLIHNFNISKNDDLYNPANYQLNIDINNAKYTAHVDLNFFQYLINAAKKEQPNELFREAVAYLVFFQIAGIEVDPTYAIYEKINHKPERTSDAIADLEIFRGINNHDSETLAKYALGISNNIKAIQTIPLDREHLRQELNKYERLTDWDSLYLMILAITHVAFDKTVSKQDKLQTYIKWCIKYFQFSLAASVYAIVLFSNSPLHAMMKFKLNMNSEERKKSLQNMTWDLYYMHRFFRLWVEKAAGHEYFLVSRDRAFFSILGLAVEVQKNSNWNALDIFLGDSKNAISDLLKNPNDQNIERIFRSEKWTPEHRKKLIRDFEARLLVL